MLLLSLAALLSSCAAEGNDKKQDLIVKTTQAVPVSHQGDKEFSFIARPFRTSELSFRVGGPIDRFDVYAGNRYQQGSIIAEIDPRMVSNRQRIQHYPNIQFIQTNHILFIKHCFITFHYWHGIIYRHHQKCNAYHL